MANSWITALKKWNKKKGGSWCIPKKGTKDYEEVRAMMSKTPKKEFSSLEEWRRERGKIKKKKNK